ncbi:MAG: calcium-binding protein, partial [Pseudomonadota bacterium]
MANIDGNNGNNNLEGTNAADRIDANGGNDTVNALGGNDTIFGDGGNDLLNGGDGADSIRGGDGNDTLEGGAGADFMNGDSGRDVVSYASSDAAVRVELNRGTGQGGHAEGDTYDGIDGFIGSAFNDRLILRDDRGNLFLSGGEGRDILDLRQFQDLRNDDLSSFEEIFIFDNTGGRRGFNINSDQLSDIDTFRIGNTPGPDNIDIFIDLVNGVNVDLSNIQMVGFDGNDTIRIRGENNADSIVGSTVNDRIEAESGNDTARGGLGNDTIFGQNGNDRLFGDEGDDELFGQDGNDLLEGGAGADRLDGGGGQDTVSYASSDAAVIVELNRGTGRGGHAEGDTYSGIDGFIGSNFGDRLVLRDNRDNLLYEGGNGNDTLRVQEFQEFRNDTLSSFEEIEIFDATSGRKGFNINASQLEDVERISILNPTGQNTAVEIIIFMDTDQSVDLSRIEFANFDSNDIVRIIGDGT